MFIKRAPWALPILLALAGCGGGNGGLTTPRVPDVPAVATGHIAYVQEGQIIPEDFGRTATDIFISRADGSDLKQLSAGSGQPFNFDPALSPDGRRVAFLAQGVGRVRQAIYIVNADGTGLRRVFEAAAFVSSLSWTPDGAGLIYVAANISATDGVGNDLIYRLHADGANAAPRLVFGDGKARYEPAISPDGRALAYLSVERDEPGASEVFTVALDGASRATGTPRALTSDGALKSNLLFTPDGRRLVYAFTAPSGPVNLRYKAVDLDGTLAPALPALTDGARGLSFSPDGRHLAFGSSNYNGGINPGRGASRILVTRADGSGTPRLLTGNLEGGDQFSPSWGR